MTTRERRWTGAALLWSVAAILYFTLVPFDFAIVEGIQSVGPRTAPVEATIVSNDALLNVLLFLPAGLSFAWLRRSDGAGAASSLGVTALASFALSLTLEVAQRVLLVRTPAVSDVLANTVGGTIGGVVALRVANPFGRARHTGGASTRRPWGATGVALVVLATIVAVSVPAAARTSLDNWTDDEPLLLGNETTGTRPWHGRIERFVLLDRPAPVDELRRWDAAAPDAVRGVVAGWDFTTDAPGTPELVADGAVDPRATTDGVTFDGTGWLRSPGPVPDISGRVRHSAAFTLLIDAATGDLDQGGPARIASISDGLDIRNLTIAQDGSSLVVRLRNRLTGPSTSPEFVLRDAFVDTGLHTIVVGYDGALLRVEVDPGPGRSFRIGPEHALMLWSFPYVLTRLRLNPWSAWVPVAAYRLVALVPLAIALAAVVRERTRRRTPAIGVAAVVPVLLLESALMATIGSYTPDGGRLLVGVGIGAAAAALWPAAPRDEATRPPP